MKKNVLILAKNMSKHCIGMEGNVSVKIKHSFFIKASGARLDCLTENDLVEFDFNGNQLDNFCKKGSIELDFHLFLLKNENINFVSHTHPINTLKILCSEFANEFSESRLFPEQVVFNGKKSCLVSYAEPGEDLKNNITEEVGLYIKENKEFPKLILLKNHGIIVCGKTIDECIMITDICEKAAEIFVGAKSLGNINYLTNEEIESLMQNKKENYRKKL